MQVRVGNGAQGLEVKNAPRGDGKGAMEGSGRRDGERVEERRRPVGSDCTRPSEWQSVSERAWTPSVDDRAQLPDSFVSVRISHLLQNPSGENVTVPSHSFMHLIVPESS